MTGNVWETPVHNTRGWCILEVADFCSLADALTRPSQRVVCHDYEIVRGSFTGFRHVSLNAEKYRTSEAGDQFVPSVKGGACSPG